MVRRGSRRRKCHTNVKNGGAECMEGNRKPVEVVCVDNAMVDRGGRRSSEFEFGRRGWR